MTMPDTPPVCGTCGEPIVRAWSSREAWLHEAPAWPGATMLHRAWPATTPAGGRAAYERAVAHLSAVDDRGHIAAIANAVLAIFPDVSREQIARDVAAKRNDG